VPSQERYRCDVCFAGDWSEPRERALAPLASRFNVRIFGPWSRKLAPRSELRASLTDGFFSPAQMAAMFSSASIVLNIHRWFGEFDNGLNPRLFEAAGCGAYQLVDAKREIPGLFEVPREMVCYSSIDDIPALVEAALADRAARGAVAEAAHSRAHREHTYRARMQSLLDIVGRAGT
jgi:spore maturation protein CgeB